MARPGTRRWSPGRSPRPAARARSTSSRAECGCQAGGLILGQSGGQLLLIAAILGMFLTILTPGLALAARVIVIAIMALLLAFGWMPVYLGLPPIHWTRLFVSARLQRWTGQITYR